MSATIFPALIVSESFANVQISNREIDNHFSALPQRAGRVLCSNKSGEPFWPHNRMITSGYRTFAVFLLSGFKRSRLFAFMQTKKAGFAKMQNRLFNHSPVRLLNSSAKNLSTP